MSYFCCSSNTSLRITNLPNYIELMINEPRLDRSTFISHKTSAVISMNYVRNMEGIHIVSDHIGV